MNKNADQKLDLLFAAARAEQPDTSRLEFGFETRLAARLREESGASLFAWAWRLWPAFAAVTLAASWWSYASLRAEADAEIVAEATQATDEKLLVAYLTGDRP
jgi:hypothetical protein